jgi:hypothetical protein
MQNCAIVSTDLRLYGFASEDLDDLRHAPEVMQRFKAFMTLRKRNWRFSGLAQTCKQIRAEYRPLWLRNVDNELQLEKLRDLYRLYSKTNMPSFPKKIEPVLQKT